ncbi:twin-arginine translocation signal domain-containing protein [Mesorhizobium sp.]
MRQTRPRRAFLRRSSAAGLAGALASPQPRTPSARH